MSEKQYTESVDDAALRRKLKAMIRDLGDDAFAGRKFFEGMLDAYGPRQTLAFIESKAIVLDEEEGLDSSDFKGHPQHAYQQSRMKIWSRRGVFSVVAGGYAGAVFAAHGLTGMAEQGEKTLRGRSDYAKPLREGANELMPSADASIGAAIMSESYEVYISGRLKEISEAVWQFSQRFKRERAAEKSMEPEGIKGLSR